MLLLKKLMGQASEISLKDAVGPDNPMEKGDRIIGVMSDGLKRLWLVLSVALASFETVADEVQTWIKPYHDEKKSPPKNEERRMKEKYFLTKEYAELAAQIFWASVHAEFPETVGENVGTRDDWQMVIADPLAQFEVNLQAAITEAFERARLEQ